MKTFAKALSALCAVLVLLIAIVMGIRAYNSNQYSTGQSDPRVKSTYEVSSDVRSIEDGDVNGFHFSPADRKFPGTVVVFGGSEGSPAYDQARMLADAGHEVLSLFFWGQPGQQDSLSEVPLELFDHVSQYIENNVDQPKPVTVIGTSKGAEFVGNLAARGRDIDHIVLFTPAEYTYQGLNFGRESKSSFTDQGQPVPFLSFQDADRTAAQSMFFDMLFGLPMHYRPVYESLPSRADNSEEARIKIEKFKGDGLLFAGDQDAMWQGDVAAKDMAQENSGLEAHVFHDAGHLFAEDITQYGKGWKKMFGGTEDGNKAAKEESDRILLQKLKQWHSPN